MTNVQSSITDTLTAIDQTKTILLCSWRTPDGTTANIGQKMVRGRFTSSTQMTFDRGSTGEIITEIAWEAVEFTDGSTVQNFTESYAAADGQNDTTITAIDQAKAIAIASGMPASRGRCDRTTNDVPGESLYTADLTTTTNLQTRRNATVDAAAAEFYVAEFNDTVPSVFKPAWAGQSTIGDGFSHTC